MSLILPTRREVAEIDLPFVYGGEEPVVAYRIWQNNSFEVGGHRAEPRLCSVGRHVAWPTRERMAAVCDPAGSVDSFHRAPWAGCECGIWSFKDRASAEQALVSYSGAPRPPCGYAIGTVSIWGRIVESEHGYRSQYAYPREIEVVGDHDTASRETDDLATLYGIRAVWIGLPDDLKRRQEELVYIRPSPQSAQLASMLAVGSILPPSFAFAAPAYSPPFQIGPSAEDERRARRCRRWARLCEAFAAADALVWWAGIGTWFTWASIGVCLSAAQVQRHLARRWESW